METKRVLALDIGTSSIKAGVVDEKGRLLAYVHHALYEDPLRLEAWDPAWWELALENVILRLHESFAASGENSGSGLCHALVMSGNGPTLVALDKKGQALSPVLLWISGEGQRLEGEKSFFLPKVRHFIQKNPGVMDRVSQFISCPEYLCLRLGARPLTICPRGEFRSAYWSDEALEASGLDTGLFPPFVEPGALMGHVDKEGSRRFGLSQGLPVYAGGSDFLMSLAGSACLEPGLICDRAGSSEGLNLCVTAPLSGPGIRNLPHLRPGYFNSAAILGTTGLMFEWFRRLTGQTGKPYDLMMQEIEALRDYQDQPYFLPRLTESGQRDFSKSMFMNLGPGHGAAHLARAVVESLGFSVRRSLEIFRESGAEPRELRISGGQSRNEAWNRMKADILGMPVSILAIRDAELAGNAMMGFLGLGIFGNLMEAAEAVVRVESIVEPDPARHEVYSCRYAGYRAMESKLRNLLS